MVSVQTGWLIITERGLERLPAAPIPIPRQQQIQIGTPMISAQIMRKTIEPTIEQMRMREGIPTKKKKTFYSHTQIMYIHLTSHPVNSCDNIINESPLYWVTLTGDITHACAMI